MIKKLTISLILAVSVLGVMPFGASAQWKQDEYKNYSWSENGVKVTGWKQIDGQWYYFGNDGIMITGWMQDNGSWYYFWSNGMMANKTWLWNGGYWYYFNENGKLATDQALIGERKYNIAPTLIVSENVNNSSQANLDAANK